MNDDIICDILELASKTANYGVAEDIIRAHPQILSQPLMRRLTRYSKTWERCTDIRPSISYKYVTMQKAGTRNAGNVANVGPMIPTKPRLNYDFTKRREIPYKDMAYANKIQYNTYGTNVDTKTFFTLRGYEWGLETCAILPGARYIQVYKKTSDHLITTKDKHTKHYTNACSPCSCELHHDISQSCIVCKPLLNESPEFISQICAEIPSSTPLTLCSVRRMTRCHHIGRHASKIEYIYFEMKDRIDNWVDVQDRMCNSPSKRLDYKKDHPQILPCLRNISIHTDIPYYQCK